MGCIGNLYVAVCEIDSAVGQYGQKFERPKNFNERQSHTEFHQNLNNSEYNMGIHDKLYLCGYVKWAL